MYRLDGEDRLPIARIETAPMIGLFASLLALFLLVLSPPAANAGMSIFDGCVLRPPGYAAPRELPVAIDGHGNLSLAGRAIDAAVLEDEMRLAAAAPRGAVVTVRVAKTTRMQDFVDVLAAAQRQHVAVSPGAAE